MLHMLIVQNLMHLVANAINMYAHFPKRKEISFSSLQSHRLEVSPTNLETFIAKSQI